MTNMIKSMFGKDAVLVRDVDGVLYIDTGDSLNPMITTYTMQNSIQSSVDAVTQFNTTVISAAQIIAGEDSGLEVELVPSPGPGNAIEFISAQVYVEAGTVNFQQIQMEGTPLRYEYVDFSIYPGGASDTSTLVYHEENASGVNTVVLDLLASQVSKSANIFTSSNGVAKSGWCLVENTNLVCKFTGPYNPAYVADCFLGITVRYRVVTLPMVLDIPRNAVPVITSSVSEGTLTVTVTAPTGAGLLVSPGVAISSDLNSIPSPDVLSFSASAGDSFTLYAIAVGGGKGHSAQVTQTFNGYVASSGA